MLKVKIINKLKQYYIKFLNLITAKIENRIIFISNPDFSDNSKGLWEYVKTLNKFNCYWIVKSSTVMEKLEKQDIKCFLYGSKEAIRALITAKIIVCTHSQFVEYKTGKQILINLWHGMPLKCMGYLDKACTPKDLKGFELASRKSDFFIATSNIMKYALSSCFRMDPRKILITGQPRNDQLFSSVKTEKLQVVLGENYKQYKKFILYCPTFRSGMGRNEGIKICLNPFNFADYDSNSLGKVLKSHNALLVIKLHPFEEEKYSAEALNLPENAMLIKSGTLNNNCTSLYDILNIFDVLITDYSSIYFDFLLLDRPVIFINNDLEEYRNDRGIIFNDYDFWTPGPKVRIFSDFTNQLKLCLENKMHYGKERKLINKLINNIIDNNSSKRVIDQLKNYL